MTRKQLETRTENARMAGQDKRHLLNRNAQHLKKPLGYIAGLTKLGLQRCQSGRHHEHLTGTFAKQNAFTFLQVPEQRALMRRFCRS